MVRSLEKPAHGILLAALCGGLLVGCAAPGPWPDYLPAVAELPDSSPTPWDSRARQPLDQAPVSSLTGQHYRARRAAAEPLPPPQLAADQDPRQAPLAEDQAANLENLTALAPAQLRPQSRLIPPLPPNVASVDAAGDDEPPQPFVPEPSTTPLPAVALEFPAGPAAGTTATGDPAGPVVLAASELEVGSTVSSSSRLRPATVESGPPSTAAAPAPPTGPPLPIDLPTVWQLAAGPPAEAEKIRLLWQQAIDTSLSDGVTWTGWLELPDLAAGLPPETPRQLTADQVAALQQRLGDAPVAAEPDAAWRAIDAWWHLAAAQARLCNAQGGWEAARHAVRQAASRELGFSEQEAPAGDLLARWQDRLHQAVQQRDAAACHLAQRLGLPADTPLVPAGGRLAALPAGPLEKPPAVWIGRAWATKPELHAARPFVLESLAILGSPGREALPAAEQESLQRAHILRATQPQALDAAAARQLLEQTAVEIAQAHAAAHAARQQWHRRCAALARHAETARSAVETAQGGRDAVQAALAAIEQRIDLCDACVEALADDGRAWLALLRAAGPLALP